ncbi:MAG: hypothetical protein J6I73_04260 [Treponema sp.]|nr:hypothetical protein [Treponema sp.]
MARKNFLLKNFSREISSARIFATHTSFALWLLASFLLFTSFLLASCAKNAALVQVQPITERNGTSSATMLPQKQDAQSMLMSKSPITPRNIDSYLFFDDCIYVDVRSAKMFYEEGHIAGFTNIPFYGYIADFPNSHNALFKMTRRGGTYLGDVGSFSENYEDAASIIYDMLDKNKNIIAISTAGVESCYFLNLLVQLGYDETRLYNAGCFTNGMGNDIAYKTYRDARYLVHGIALPATNITYTIDSLAKIKD